MAFFEVKYVWDAPKGSVGVIQITSQKAGVCNHLIPTEVLLSIVWKPLWMAHGKRNRRWNPSTARSRQCS